MQKLDQAPKAADAAVSSQSPLDLTAVFSTGAAYHGVRVLSLRIELADGTVQRVQLPSPKRAGGLSPAKQQIMRVLASSPVPLTRLALAHRCGKESATGRFGQNLRELIEVDQKVCQFGQEVSDDPAKFDAEAD